MFLRNQFNEKEIDVGDVTLIIKYSPKTGELGFARKGDSKGVGLTGVGAFATINAIAIAFQEESLERIVYSAKGKTLREMRVKSKLYAREMKRRGYHLVKTYHNTYRHPILWTCHSKKYVWEKI